MAGSPENPWGEALDGLSEDPQDEPEQWNDEVLTEEETSYEQGYGQQFETEEPAQDELDEEMTEAERRLAKATLYRQFVTGNIFDGDSQEAREVENEFRLFARYQLRKLLGVGDDAQNPMLPFDDLQVKVLRAVADQVIASKKLRSGPPKPPPRQAPAPKPKPPARPQLRPRPLPEDVRPRMQPRQQPQPPRRPVAAPRPPQQQRQPQRPPQRPQAPVQQKPPASDPNVVHPDEALITESGKKFKVKWVETHPGAFGEKAEQALENLAPGRAMRVGAIQVFKTEGGEYFKIVKRDLTPQRRGAGMVPFPAGRHQMEAITAQRSGEALNAVPADILSKANAVING